MIPVNIPVYTVHTHAHTLPHTYTPPTQEMLTRQLAASQSDIGLSPSNAGHHLDTSINSSTSSGVIGDSTDVSAESVSPFGQQTEFNRRKKKKFVLYTHNIDPTPHKTLPLNHPKAYFLFIIL